MEYLIMASLSAIIIIIAVKYFMLKRQIKSISKQLDDEEAKLVTVSLADIDICGVVRKINILLERIWQTVIRENISTMALKDSIANISHDMKTPLTSVIGYLQLACKECTDSDMKEKIEICLERTKYCNDLINVFFELSLVEAQGCSPDMESIDAAGELCEQILANYPMFEERKIKPHFQNSDKPVMVLADKIMLQRIMQNLISNSIKYTCGDVYFDIADGECVMITISNPVSGNIDTEHIFDKFYVQDEAGHRGYGIGLYLCREFAEIMGGGILAEWNEGSLKISLRLKK